MTPTSTDVTGSGGVADPADLALSAAAVPPAADSPPPEPEPPRKKRGGGPKSVSGRAASARNAIREGLRSKKLLPPDLEAIAVEKLKSLRETYRPTDQGEEDQLLIMARCAAQLEKVWADKLFDFVRIRDRAEHSWDDDRNIYVDVLVGRLEKDCTRAARALRRSKQGVEYLMKQFDELGLLVEAQGTLTKLQREHLFKLMGIPIELREGNTRVPLATDDEALLDFIESEVKELAAHLEDSLNRGDAFERQCAFDGYALEADHKTRLIRKYEADLIRERNRALAELLRVRAERSRPAPAPAPASPPPAPASGPPPAPPPSPPPDLPDLPPRPVQSNADAWHMFKMSVETATDLTVLACEASKAQAEAGAAAATEADPVVTAPPEPAAAAADPVVTSHSEPAMAAAAPATPQPAPARPATSSPQPAADAERKRREDAERKRRRDLEKKARKKGRRQK